MPGSKVELGQFYTTTNPFTHPRVVEWLCQHHENVKWLEPFAGANNIVRMVHEIVPGAGFTSFDIQPGAVEVAQRDTLTSFPAGFDVVVTNPPYLARNSAKRRGLDQAVALMGDWPDLYLRCLEECLNNTSHVAAIIPESFIVSNVMRERLSFVVSLNQKMFDDTEHPVCLAVFDPVCSDDHDVYVGERRIGGYNEIAAKAYAPVRTMRFNDPDGRIGLCAVDGSTRASIAFVAAEKISRDEIKHSSRHRTRISVPQLAKKSKRDIALVIERANSILDHWRDETGDVLLSPFMGLRADGLYRRRIDFGTASGILAQAMIDVGIGGGTGRGGRGR